MQKRWVPHSEKKKRKRIATFKKDNLCVKAKKNKRFFFFFSLAMRHTQKLL